MAIFFLTETAETAQTFFLVEAMDCWEARHLVALNCHVLAHDTGRYSCEEESTLTVPHDVIFSSATGKTAKITKR
jgi:hypothetical protein